MSLLSSPIEIIEKILSHLLLPSFVDSSSSTILSSSLKGTTSILLVSKDFRALALPIFWRTVVVSKNRHWKDLFGRDRGLLVVEGEEGEKRRWWLRDVVVAVNASFFEDGTFGTDFACCSPMSTLRGKIRSLQLVAVAQEEEEKTTTTQIAEDASHSNPLILLPSSSFKKSQCIIPPSLQQSTSSRIRSLLLSLHVGESLQFILRSFEPKELELPFVDWIFVEDRNHPYLPPIKGTLRSGPSSFGYLSVGVDSQGVAGRVETSFPKSDFCLVGFGDVAGASEVGSVNKGGSSEDRVDGERLGLVRIL